MTESQLSEIGASQEPNSIPGEARAPETGPRPVKEGLLDRKLVRDTRRASPIVPLSGAV